jgi:3-isopropylmalate/(R)-2-methylmalate dehydratase small subunit
VKAFRKSTVRVAVLDRGDVDTDQIIPKQFLKRIERTGYGEFLFFDWMKDPEFELRRAQYEGAQVLVAGRNFGCGSSREHAAWAIQQAGYDAVVAPSFGDIFRNNSLKTGLLPIQLDADEVRALMEEYEGGGELTVDLEAQQLVTASGRMIPFEVDSFARESILDGLDDIGLTLRRDDEISAYEAAHAPRVQTTAAA